MITHISRVIDRVINSAKLTQLENKVLDKYESLLPAVKKEETVEPTTTAETV